MASKAELLTRLHAIRAVNILIFEIAESVDSENLRLLGGEMSPVEGRPEVVTWDPAMEDAWNRLWGTPERHTWREVARIAAEFIKTEGNWGEPDDGHTMLAIEMQNISEGLRSVYSAQFESAIKEAAVPRDGEP